MRLIKSAMLWGQEPEKGKKLEVVVFDYEDGKGVAKKIQIIVVLCIWVPCENIVHIYGRNAKEDMIELYAYYYQSKDWGYQMPGYVMNLSVDQPVELVGLERWGDNIYPVVLKSKGIAKTFTNLGKNYIKVSTDVNETYYLEGPTGFKFTISMGI